jgi:hypothetical protein
VSVVATEVASGAPLVAVISPRGSLYSVSTVLVFSGLLV